MLNNKIYLIEIILMYNFDLSLILVLNFIMCALEQIIIYYFTVNSILTRFSFNPLS